MGPSQSPPATSHSAIALFFLADFGEDCGNGQQNNRVSASTGPSGRAKNVPTEPPCDGIGRHRHAGHGRSQRAGLSDQADHPDRALARRRLDRHLDARDRRERLQGAGPADRDRQQGRRRRYGGSGHHGGRIEARWLHHRATPDHRVPPAPDAGGVVGPIEGLSATSSTSPATPSASPPAPKGRSRNGRT